MIRADSYGKLILKDMCNMSQKILFKRSIIGKYLEISEKDNNRISLNYGNFQFAEIDLDEQLVVSRKNFRR